MASARAIRPFSPGTLWSRIVETTQRACRSGALEPISTGYKLTRQAGIQFIVRMLARIDRKERAAQRHAQTAAAYTSPFLPPEDELFVADVSPTHFCVLNKFKVIQHHLLIVTREFEEQENWLTRADFEALARCMREFEGVGFYNGGERAGASQQHKHLQLVPLPLVPEGPPIPIEPVLRPLVHRREVGRAPDLPFVHAVARLPSPWWRASDVAGKLLGRYYELLRATGLLHAETPSTPKQTRPYNLLLTRDWMLLVPRSQGKFQGVEVNALGFAGSLFARNEAAAAVIKSHGPLGVLRGVARPVEQ